MLEMTPPTHVLFDLDGTLLDTAPDLAAALNAARSLRALAPLPFSAIRPSVSHGSFALARIGCDFDEGSEAFERFRLDLLESYAANVARESSLFDGMDELLGRLESIGIPWGIVTNKPEYLTAPLLHALDLTERAAVVICGDTAPNKKPHPEPLLLAASRINARPERCVYIGDAERDIVAGKAAGMTTVVALYGYIGTCDAPLEWGADAAINHPRELPVWLNSF